MSQTLIPTSETPTRDVLTQAEAIERAGRVTAVDYTLRIDLQPGQRTYRGDCTIDFRVRDTSQPLFIDFKGGRIDEFTVNGSTVVPARKGDRIVIPAESLAERMHLRVRYENAFDTGGDGLHRFVDPEDGQEYLYSNFQPFSAHRLFPCFDQPDIKATYELTVDAPADWQVVSSDRPTGEPEALADGRLRHSFGRTPPFSTYLLALVAGPYHVIRRRDGTASSWAFTAGARWPRSWPQTPMRSSRSPSRASTSMPNSSSKRIRSPSTTSCSCPSSTSGRWRTWAR